MILKVLGHFSDILNIPGRYQYRKISVFPRNSRSGTEIFAQANGLELPLDSSKVLTVRTGTATVKHNYNRILLSFSIKSKFPLFSSVPLLVPQWLQHNPKSINNHSQKCHFSDTENISNESVRYIWLLKKITATHFHLHWVACGNFWKSSGKHPRQRVRFFLSVSDEFQKWLFHRYRF